MARTVGLSADSMNRKIESSRKRKVHCGIGHPRRATRTVHCSWCYATPTRDCLGVVACLFFLAVKRKERANDSTWHAANNGSHGEDGARRTSDMVSQASCTTMPALLNRRCNTSPCAAATSDCNCLIAGRSAWITTMHHWDVRTSAYHWIAAVACCRLELANEKRSGVGVRVGGILAMSTTCVVMVVLAPVLCAFCADSHAPLAFSNSAALMSHSASAHPSFASKSDISSPIPAWCRGRHDVCRCSCRQVRQ